MASTNGTSTCLISRADFDQYKITDLPDSVIPVWIVLACINGITSPFTITLNGLIIGAIKGNQQLRSKSYNVLLAILALCDLLVGLIAQPLACWYLVCLSIECTTPCLDTATIIAISIFGGITLCTLMILSVERFLAIRLPVWHWTHVTTKRLMVVAAVMWLSLPSYMITLNILLNSYKNIQKLSSLRFILGIVIVIVYCTIRVNVTAYGSKKTRSLHLQSQQRHQKNGRYEQISEYKRAFTMGILVLTSIIFYLPFIISQIIQSVKGKDFTHEFQYIAAPIACTFINLQSSINPIITTLRMAKIRKKIKKILYRNIAETEV